VRDFDRSAEVDQLALPGLDLLKFDAHYVLYHRRHKFRQDTAAQRIASPFATSIQTVSGLPMRLVHAPGFLVLPLAQEARSMKIFFGFPPIASEGADATNGAIFSVWLVDGPARTRLHERKLEPGLRPVDRGLQSATLDLPVRRHPEDAHLVLETDAMGNTSKDWTLWSEPDFK
jgi:hypothetical protein